MREQRPFLARIENPIQLKTCFGEKCSERLASNVVPVTERSTNRSCSVHIVVSWHALEIEYLKVSQGISKLGTAQKELGSWKLSISRYLKVSQGISRYLKVSQGISRLGTAQKEYIV